METIVCIATPLLLIAKLADGNGSAKRELLVDQLSSSEALLLIGEVDVVTDQSVCLLHGCG